MPGQDECRQPGRAEKPKCPRRSSIIKFLCMVPAIVLKGLALGLVLGMVTSFTNWLYLFQLVDPMSSFLMLGVLIELCLAPVRLIAHRDPHHPAYVSIPGPGMGWIRGMAGPGMRLLVPTRAELTFMALVVVLGSTQYYMPALAGAITDHYDRSGYYRGFAQAFASGGDDGARMKSIINWSNGHFTGMYRGDGAWPICPVGQPFLMCSISPPALTIRVNDNLEPLKTEYEWTLITGAGNCGENSIMTLGLADISGIPIRRTSLQGEDHVFNEAFIGGRWIVVDPLNPFDSGYDIPPRFYEDGWRYNVSYVYARYPNGTIEDVTPRYTDVGYIDLAVKDDRGKPVDNATVKVYSNNRRDLPPASLPMFTNLTARTGADGTVRLRIGDGNYTIAAGTGDRFGKLRAPLKANETAAMELIIAPKGPVNYLVDLLKRSDAIATLLGMLGVAAMAYMLLVLMKLYGDRLLWAGVLMFLGIFLAYLSVTLARLVLVF